MPRSKTSTSKSGNGRKGKKRNKNGGKQSDQDIHLRRSNGRHQGSGSSSSGSSSSHTHSSAEESIEIPPEPNQALIAARQQYQDKNFRKRTTANEQTSLLDGARHRSIHRISVNNQQTGPLEDSNSSSTTPPSEEPTQSWWSNAWSKTKTAASYTWYAASTTPFVIFSYLNPTGKSPKDFSLQFWLNMPLKTHIHAALNALSSFGLNAVLMYYFSGKTTDNLKKSFARIIREGAEINLLKHPISLLTSIDWKELAIIITSMGLASGAALSSFGIGYSSWLWLPLSNPGKQIAQTLLAIPSLVMTLFTRYLGVNDTIHNTVYTFQAEGKAIQAFLADLNRIQQSDKQQLETAFDTIVATALADTNPEDFDTPFNAKQYQAICIELAEYLINLSNNNDMSVDQNCWDALWEYTQRYTFMTADTLLALLIGYHVFLVYMQHGLNGINFFAQLNNDDLNNMNLEAERGLGSVLAMGTALFYALNAYHAREVIMRLAHHISTYPRDLLYVLPILAASGLSSSSAQGVAKNIAENPKNIVGITPHTRYSQAVAQINAAGGGTVNAINVLNAVVFPKPTPTNVTLPDVVRYLKNTTHPVPASTVAKFKLFSAKVNQYPDAEEQPQSGLRNGFLGSDK